MCAERQENEERGLPRRRKQGGKPEAKTVSQNSTKKLHTRSLIVGKGERTLKKVMKKKKEGTRAASWVLEAVKGAQKGTLAMTRSLCRTSLGIT